MCMWILMYIIIHIIDEGKGIFFGLKDFRLRGAGNALVVVVLRLLSASALGAFLAFVLVPALGSSHPSYIHIK